jgi:hypothetical protein
VHTKFDIYVFITYFIKSLSMRKPCKS